MKNIRFYACIKGTCNLIYGGRLKLNDKHDNI